MLELHMMFLAIFLVIFFVYEGKLEVN